MTYEVYVSLNSGWNCKEETEIEIDDNATDEEVKEICRDTAFDYVEWNYEKKEDSNE